MDSTARSKALADFYHPNDDDWNLIDFSFAVLIGGKGSPPHVDTITDLLSRCLNDEGDPTWKTHLTLAVGYIAQVSVVLL